MAALDISDVEGHELFDTLDADGNGNLDLAELMEGIAKLRGEARRSDIVAMGLTIKSVQAELKEHITQQMGAWQQTQKELKSVSPVMRRMSQENLLSGVL